MKKIAIVARNISGKTGVSNTILKQAVWLAERDWNVTLLGNKIKREPLTHPHIQIKTFPDIKIGSYIKRRLFSWMVQRYIKNKNFSIVHGHGDSIVQDIVSLHNCVHKTHETIYQKPLSSRSGVGKIHHLQLARRTFKHLIANSHLMKNDLMSRFAISEDAITVIYPGHDPEKFNPHNKKTCRTEIEDLWRIPKHCFVVGFLSSGDFNKRNLKTLLHALSLLPVKERDTIRCLIVGYDTTIPSYRKRAERLGVSPNVIFTGFQKDPDTYLKSFDVYVHPALFEEFGQTVQEALACGIPTITTNTTGASELITGEARSLLLTNSLDAQKIASLILYIKKNPIKRTQISLSSPAMVSKNSWHHNFTQVEEIYRKVMSGKENVQ